MTKRIALLVTAIVLAAPWSVSKWTGIAFAGVRDAHAMRHMIRIIPRNGPARVEALEGVGCSEAICSRVFIRARVEGEGGTVVLTIRFDTVAAIDMIGGGDARVRFIDGRAQRVVVASDNQVLYLLDNAGHTKKVDLSETSSIEFLR